MCMCLIDFSLIFHDRISPIVWNIDGLVGFKVESNHDGGALALDGFSVLTIDALLQAKAFSANVGDGGFNSASVCQENRS